jgi:hypothetical protein
MRRAIKIAAWLVGFFILFSIVGFFVVPPVMKSVLVKKLSENLHRQVSIGEIKVNPYLLSVSVKKIAIKERQKSDIFVSLDEIYTQVSALSVFKRALLVKELKIVKPYFNIIRGADESFNFSDLLAAKEGEKAQAPPPEKKEKKPFLFSVNNIVISGAQVEFFDGGEKVQHSIKDMNIAVPFISNTPYYVSRYVEPAFSANINGAAYSLQGKTKPFAEPMEMHLDINIKDLNLPKYMAYLPVKANFTLLSGAMDLTSKISFVQPKGRTPILGISGNIALKNIAVDDLEKHPVVRLPAISVTIASAEPLLKTAHLSKVLITTPELNAKREEDGSISLASLVEEEKKIPKKDVSSKKGGGKISSKAAAKIASKAPAKVPAKTPAKVEEALPFYVSIDEFVIDRGKVSFRDLAAPHPMDVSLAEINVKMNVSSAQPKDKAPTLGISGDIVLKNIAVNDLQKRPMARLPSITVSIASIEPLLKSARVSKVAIISPDLNVKREEDGTVNLASLGTEGKETSRKDMASRKAKENTSLKAVSKTPERTPEKTKAKTDEGPDFNAVVDEFLIEKGKVSFRDLAAPHQVDGSVTNLNLKCNNIATAKGSKGTLTLSLVLNKKGTISVKGPFAVNPVSADLAVDLKTINIGPFQPYFTDKVKINTTSGHINTKGKVLMSLDEKKGFKTRFTGTVLMGDFASVDKVNGDDFLKWKTFSLSNMDVGYNPLYIHIGAVSLSDFYARVTLNPDGTLSLTKIVEEEAGEGTSAAAAETGKKEPPPAKTEKTVQAGKPGTQPEKDQDITVGSITLQNGKIDFTDKAIKPPYSVDLTEMTGRISGFSLKLDQRADLELRGKINNQVPLEILGKINPKRDNLFTDVTVRFKDLDLSAMSPYSGKYLGYKIAKGNLSVDLKYLIEKRQLDSGNVILIDQLTLGDPVDSPDAVKLPLGLALALLKDRKGQINFDIPVSGSLDDPKFSIWKIVVKVLLNLITKAATAPFALIGSLFGGGEELSYVEFDYGKSALDQGANKKIDTVVKALYERPALKLDIEGHVDMDKDRDALKIYLFNRKLKTQKMNVLARKGESSATAVDDVMIEPGEYNKYLTMAYKAEKFEKPKNVIGFAKGLPAPEMEKLMYAHITVSEGDLRALAIQRTGRVKDAILASGKVTADRLFALEPKTLAPEKKDKVKDSRVDFKLK